MPEEVSRGLSAALSACGGTSGGAVFWAMCGIIERRRSETGMNRSRGVALGAAVSAVALLALFGGRAGFAATLVVANKDDATVSLLDLASGRIAATVPTGDGPHEVAISPDGRQAVVSNTG